MISRLAFLALLLATPFAPILAAGGAGSHPSAPTDRADYASLQRGAALFVGYCMGCHGAEHVRYGRLSEDLKIPPDLLRKTLAPAGAGMGDGMRAAARAKDLEAWLNQSAPDLSLSARLRGADWLYAYLRGFYRDNDSPTGWNNVVFPNVAMPHVLADLQGERALVGGDLRVTKAGRISTAEYNRLAADVVNFLDYIADPARPLRHRFGYALLSALSLLLVFAYFLYREYWRDVR